jgi:hydrogenase expression/formation protein HypD
LSPSTFCKGCSCASSNWKAAAPRSKTNTAAPCGRRAIAPRSNSSNEVFQVVPRKWRGIGEIPQSGLGLRDAYAGFDAERKFGVAGMRVDEPTDCLSGLVLQGKIKPHECPAFGAHCTPEHPLGATMVSSEGACAAYYRYRREPSSRAA